jgi:hypothetical protein
MKLVGFLLLPLALAGGPLHAADSPFVWEKTSVHVAATPEQRTVTVEFPFRNGRGAAVTILSLETSCRCLSATSRQMTYAAGEKGMIEVALAIGHQQGALEKSVTVTTDAPDTGPTELTLTVDVPAAR